MASALYLENFLESKLTFIVHLAVGEHYIDLCILWALYAVFLQALNICHLKWNEILLW